MCLDNKKEVTAAIQKSILIVTVLFGISYLIGKISNAEEFAKEVIRYVEIYGLEESRLFAYYVSKDYLWVMNNYVLIYIVMVIITVSCMLSLFLLCDIDDI